MNYSQASKYLIEERKLTPATIEEFQIAFCDKRGYLYAGTGFPKDFSQLQETYFDSLIFPIHDLYGTCIGIMTRRMYPSKSKYVNSANNSSFTKGKHLFGLYKSYPHILEAKEVIVVEGLFDFLQLYQSGVKNVVATMGTALTDTHIALLSRFTKNVVVLPDPDAAGDRFGVKSSYALRKHINCKVVRLPTTQDPDEYIIANGVDAFRQHLASAQAS